MQHHLFRRVVGRFICIMGTIMVVASPSDASNSLTVPGASNIFGAGHAAAPGPGGSAGVGPGGGLLPSSFDFAPGPGLVLTFSSVTGSVSNDFRSRPYVGPDGGSSAAPTNVSSFGGISGIQDGNTMFLIGVFLDGTEPVDPAPPVLAFTAPEDFLSLAPVLNQTFFIGDGLTGTGTGTVQQFLVPNGASRLFLGFADAFNGSSETGPPGYYDDDGGSMIATFDIAVPEPASLVLLLTLGATATGARIRFSRRR